MKKTEKVSKNLHQKSSEVYGQKWLLTDSFQIIGKEIPTFTQIDSKAQHLKKQHYRKRQLIKENLPDVEELVKNFNKSRIKYKIIQSIKAKKEEKIDNCKPAFQPENYKIPDHGLKVGSPLYLTSNMDYGRLKPTIHETHNKQVHVWGNRIGGFLRKRRFRRRIMGK